jgi:predicted PurR-regulated permease PerM
MSETLKRIAPWLQFAVFVLVVAVLYFGQAILVPLALAALLTFLLTPVVVFLQRYLGRIAAVLVAVTLTFSLMGVIGWGLASELNGLAHDLPGYHENIRQRIGDLRGASRGGAVEKVQETVEDIKDAIQGGEPVGRQADKTVVVPGAGATEWWDISTNLGPLLSMLATGALVVVLAIFMLLERQELRNRLIRMVGFARVSRTTTALDEAASRISRYLLMHSLINGTFGLGVGLGLMSLGLPYVLFWAFLGAALRFVPYIGPWDRRPGTGRPQPGGISGMDTAAAGGGPVRDLGAVHEPRAGDVPLRRRAAGRFRRGSRAREPSPRCRPRLSRAQRGGRGCPADARRSPG